MAVKEFNCNKLKRTFWPFTLKDKVGENGEVLEKGKKIVVRMPQKQVFEAIKDLEEWTRKTPKLKIQTAFTDCWRRCLTTIWERCL